MGRARCLRTHGDVEVETIVFELDIVNALEAAKRWWWVAVVSRGGGSRW